MFSSNCTSDRIVSLNIMKSSVIASDANDIQVINRKLRYLGMISAFDTTSGESAPYQVNPEME